MRPIKFKIWYPDSKLMEGPFDIDLFYIRNSVHPKFESSDKHIYLQYTGLKDKNDKEIYEGDVLGCSFLDNIDNVFINFEHGSFCANTLWIQTRSLWNLRFSMLNFEVIGNIYQHPQLMNKDKTEDESNI